MTTIFGDQPAYIPIATCRICRGSRTLPGYCGGDYVCGECILRQVRDLLYVAVLDGEPADLLR